MRKVLFLSLLLVGLTGLASADVVNFFTFGAATNTLTTSGSNILVDTWTTSSNMGSLNNTLNFNIAGKSVDLGGIFSTTFLSGDLGSNNCDGVTDPCEVQLMGSASFALDSSFFAGLGIGGPNQFTLSGFIQGQNLNGGTTYSVQSWELDATQAPAVPEPASMLLLGSGLLAGAAAFRRKINL